jgi:hypothetical protein
VARHWERRREDYVNRFLNTKYIIKVAEWR